MGSSFANASDPIALGLREVVVPNEGYAAIYEVWVTNGVVPTVDLVVDVTVTPTGTPSADVNLDLGIDADGDSVSLPTTVTIPSGQMAGEMRIWVTNDAESDMGERFTVAISNPRGHEGVVIALGGDSVESTIRELPAVNLNGPTRPVAEGNDAEFTVALSEPLERPLRIGYEVVDVVFAQAGPTSSAVADGVDFSAETRLRGVVTIPPGSTADETFYFGIAEDSVSESEEIFAVAIWLETGQSRSLHNEDVVITAASAKATIAADHTVDDVVVGLVGTGAALMVAHILKEISSSSTVAPPPPPPRPTVQITPTNARVAEGESATFRATFSAPVDEAVEISWMGNADLEGTSVTVEAGTITATNLSHDFSISIADDALVEGEETVSMTFAVSGVADVTGAEQDIIIAASDDITVTITGPSMLIEGGVGDYTVTLGGGTRTGSVTLTIAVGDGGTGQSADVVLPNPATATVAAGETTATFSVTAVDDGYDAREDDETVVLTVTAVDTGGGTTATASTNPITIVQPTAAIVATDTDVAEGESATFRATFSAARQGTITINWGANTDLTGTSITIPAGTITTTNLTYTFDVPVAEDDLAEGEETVSVRFASSDVEIETGANQNITIAASNDITVTVTGPSTHEEGATEDYTATLAGGTRTDTVTLTIAVGTGGTGQAADVALPTPATETVAAGETTATFSVTMVGDGYDSTENETIVLTVTGVDAGGANVTSGSTSLITITQPLPTIIFAASDADVAEGESATFTATFSTAVVDAVTVTWGANDDLDGTEFIIPAGTITATNLAPTVEVAIRDDDLAEGEETVNVTLAVAGLGTVTGADQSITIAPSDDITIEVTGPTTHEEGATEDYTVTLGGGTRTESVTLTIVVGAGGTGQAADVALPNPATATVAAEETTATFSVTVVGDGYDSNEDAETVVLTVTGVDAGGANVTSGDSAPITINQLTGITIAPTDADVVEGQPATFTATFRTSVDEAVEIGWAADVDLVGTNVTIPAGTITATNLAPTFQVVVANDDLAEGEETVSVTFTISGLGAVTGADQDITIAASDDITVTVTGPSTHEEGAAEDYTATLGGGTRTEAVTLTIAVGTGGTGEAADVALPIPATATVAAGETAATFSVTMVGDGYASNEDAETVVLTVTGVDAGGADVTPDDSDLITITQPLPTINFTVSDTDVAEGESATFTATFSTAVVDPVTVTWNANDDLDGTEFLIPAGTITATNLAPIVEVAIRDDDLAEGEETVNVTLAVAGLGTVTGADQNITIAPSDDITIEVTGSTQLQEGQTVDYTATLGGGTRAADVTLTITWENIESSIVGTASNVQDSEITLPNPANATLSTNETTTTFSVTIASQVAELDNLLAGGQNIRLTIAGVDAGGANVIDGTIEVAITDALEDDDPGSGNSVAPPPQESTVIGNSPRSNSQAGQSIADGTAVRMDSKGGANDERTVATRQFDASVAVEDSAACKLTFDTELEVQVPGFEGENGCSGREMEGTRTAEINYGPEFPSDYWTHDLGGDAGAGTLVGTPILAIDQNVNDTLGYWLEGNDANWFEIDTSTAQITVGPEGLDPNSTTDSYVLIVAVTDGLDPSGAPDATKDGTMQVEVRILPMPEDSAVTNTAEQTFEADSNEDPLTESSNAVPEWLPHTLRQVGKQLFARIGEQIMDRFQTDGRNTTMAVAGREVSVQAPEDVVEKAVPTELGSPFAQSGVDDSWGGESGDLLSGSHFETPVQFNSSEGNVTHWSVWGGGQVLTLDGHDDAGRGGITTSGHVDVTQFGIEARTGNRWLSGISLSRSAGDVTSRVGDTNEEVAWNASGVYPYVRWAPNLDGELWSIAGMQSGTLNWAADSAEVTSNLLATGASYNFEVGKITAIEFAGQSKMVQLRSIGERRYSVPTEYDESLHHLSVKAVHELGLGMSQVELYAGAGWRTEQNQLHDGESIRLIGGAQDIALPWGFELNVDLEHSDSLHGGGRTGTVVETSLSRDAGIDRHGFAFVLHRRWSTVTSVKSGDRDAWWGNDTQGLFASDTELAPEWNLQAGYGMLMPGGRHTVIPFGELGSKGTLSRKLRVGTELDPVSEFGSWRVELFGERNVTAAEARNEIGIEASIKF